MQKGLSNYRIRQAKKRLISIFNQSNTHNLDKGLNWYHEANNFCAMVSRVENIDIDLVAQVVAILSPSVRWERNKQDTLTLINAYNTGLSIDQFSVSTYNNNKLKAWKVLQGKEILKPKSLKTYSFYKNIMLDSQYVTVDRWHLRACFKTDIKSLTALKYRQICELTRNVANELNITPMQLQAIVWEQIRN